MFVTFFTKEPKMAKKKKYYQGRKDRMDESAGMKRKSSMNFKSEDKSAFAYVPQEVMSIKYPMNDYNNEYYEDGMAKQDWQIDAMSAQSRKQNLDTNF